MSRTQQLPPPPPPPPRGSGKIVQLQPYNLFSLNVGVNSFINTFMSCLEVYLNDLAGLLPEDRSSPIRLIKAVNIYIGRQQNGTRCRSLIRFSHFCFVLFERQYAILQSNDTFSEVFWRYVTLFLPPASGANEIVIECFSAFTCNFIV